MTSEVPEGFGPADDVFELLEAIPGIDDNLPERLEFRAQMEREHKVGLAQIREVAALTQAEVAAKMGKTQTGVSRLEHRDDMLLSTLKKYLEAIGADAVITVRVGQDAHQHHLRIGLDELV